MPSLGTPERPLRIAVIGSGPSGFYAIQALLRTGREVRIDLFDRLPTPYGLVRGGVAPDHQRIKSIAGKYEELADHPCVRFWGHVTLGRDIDVHDLRHHHDAIVYAVGAEGGRRLDVPGGDLPEVYTATEFVFWYNAHPDYRDRAFPLDRVRRVVVVGNGNVAIDVTRMLAQDPERLSITDVAGYATAAFRGSSVEEVVVLGRRGAAQAAFAPKELKELAGLEYFTVTVPADEAEVDPATAAWIESGAAGRTAARNLQLVRELAHEPEPGKRHVQLRFCVSPTAFVADADGHLAGVRLRRNELALRDGDPRPRAVGEEWEEPCQMVLLAIGYRGTPIPGVPHDDWGGIIPNEEGRVRECDGTPRPGEYVVGWAKRGPTGVIGTNAPDAAATVAALLEDLDGAEVNGDRPDIRALLDARGVRYATFSDWKRIDEREVSRGEELGKIREKLVDVDEMFRVVGEEPESG